MRRGTTSRKVGEENRCWVSYPTPLLDDSRRRCSSTPSYRSPCATLNPDRGSSLTGNRLVHPADERSAGRSVGALGGLVHRAARGLRAVLPPVVLHADLALLGGVRSGQIEEQRPDGKHDGDDEQCPFHVRLIRKLKV